MSNLEVQLLGSCLIYGRESALKAWVTGLKVQHFKDPMHRSLWAMIESELKSEDFDISKVTASFLHDVKISTMMNEAIMPSSVEHFAEAIIDRARDAAINEVLVSINSTLKAKKDFDGPKVTNEAVERLYKIIYETDSKPKKVTVQEAYRKMGELWEKQAKEGYCQNVIPTGFPSLDDILNGGVRRGGVFTIAAQTGVGKSIKALNFALKAGLAGAKVLYVTVEMDDNESYSRMVAAQSSGNYSRILAGPRGQSEYDAFDMAWQKLLKTTIDVIEFHEPFIEEVEQLVRYEKIQKAYDLVIIDYVQQFRLKERHPNKTEMISAVSSFIKLRIAKRHNVAVISVAQMNRNTEAEGYSGLRLGNIADAAAIERDSDIVAILFREDPKKPTEEALQSGFDVSNLAWLKIKKHRHGVNNHSIPLKFVGTSARFDEFSADEIKEAEWNKANYVAPSKPGPKPRPKFKMTEGEKQAHTRRYGELEDF